ncbi:MAG: WYL domain-containing protein [Chloroflexota bacterium]|nr:WYL domain-containing protein [Chloroflexota bacterium]
MEEEAFSGQAAELKQREKKVAGVSTDKTLRTTLLAVLFQVSWPRRLTRQEIIKHIPFYGESESTRSRALYRDIETLTGYPVGELLEPDDEQLAEWCVAQKRRNRLAITYQRRAGGVGTFGLAHSLFSIDISEDEARAFVALQKSFVPGAPYAGAVQDLLKRWEWLFTDRSAQLVRQKRKRHAQNARPVFLPLSPVADYSSHSDIILQLDEALEENAYVSFGYTPLAQSLDTEPVPHEHVEPYELEYRDGHWYFTAYIFDLNTFIDYRVDRIRPGTLRKDGDRFAPGVRRRRGVQIRYWVSPMLARHGSLSTRLHEQQVTIVEHDQGAIVEGYAKSLWWARRLLLGYGEQVKALEPEKLVSMMREEVQAMSRLYGEGER